MCAIEIHETCSRDFVKLMENGNQICKQAEKWFECYDKQLTTKWKKCNAEIIKKYSDFVKEVGGDLVKDAIRIANLC